MPPCESFTARMNLVDVDTIWAADAIGNVLLVIKQDSVFEINVGFRNHHSEPCDLQTTICDSTVRVDALFFETAGFADGDVQAQVILSMDPNQRFLHCNALIAAQEKNDNAVAVSYVNSEQTMTCFLRSVNAFLEECGMKTELVASTMPVIYIPLEPE